MEVWLRDSETKIGIARVEMNLEQLKYLSYIKDNVGYLSIRKYDKEVGDDVFIDYKCRSLCTAIHPIGES